MHRRAILRFATLVLLPATATAHSFKHGKIAIGHAWALPVVHGDGQLFFPMVNNGEARDELVAARADICSLVELRKNNRYDEPALSSIVLEPKRPVPMRPTAQHLRLVSSRRPLQLGDRFTVVLDFLNSGEVAIEAYVEEKPGT
jgi:periplasmic copper chaperone A